MLEEATMGCEGKFDWGGLQPLTVRQEHLISEPSVEARTFEGTGSCEGLSGAAALNTLNPSIVLRVNDVKQFTYCPRVVYYQHAMPVIVKPTFKMEHGKAVELRVEQLERRRQLRKYGLGRGERRFQVWLHSERLGLSGRLDLLIVTANGMFPVDFKDTSEPVRDNHRIQLCAYARLIEDTFGTTVSTGFVYRVPREDVAVVEITAKLREATARVVREIREMIRAERMPSATPIRARCADCESRNYCGDVF